MQGSAYLTVFCRLELDLGAYENRYNGQSRNTSRTEPKWFFRSVIDSTIPKGCYPITVSLAHCLCTRRNTSRCGLDGFINVVLSTHVSYDIVPQLS